MAQKGCDATKLSIQREVILLTELYRFKKFFARREKAKKYLAQREEEPFFDGFFQKKQAEDFQDPQAKQALGFLPDFLQFALWAFFRYSQYPDENGKMQKVGGYGDALDGLGCIDELAEWIACLAPSRARLEKALAYIGTRRTIIDSFLREFAQY